MITLGLRYTNAGWSSDIKVMTFIPASEAVRRIRQPKLDSGW
jgi:hypothetical protein